MKQADDAIDKVLAGLRDAAAPEGMERRIREALEARAAAARREWGWRLPLLCGVGLAAVVAVMMIAGGTRRPSPVVRNSTSGAPPRAFAAAAPLAPMGEEKRSTIRRKRSSALDRERRGEARAMRTDGNSVEVSMVAPPLPLSQQERLLLQIARRGEPEDVPVLDPDELARREAEAEARFRARLAESPQVK
jgi:hypothetical protein